MQYFFYPCDIQILLSSLGINVEKRTKRIKLEKKNNYMILKDILIANVIFQSTFPILDNDLN